MYSNISELHITRFCYQDPCLEADNILSGLITSTYVDHIRMNSFNLLVFGITQTDELAHARRYNCVNRGTWNRGLVMELFISKLCGEQTLCSQT